MAMVDEVDWFLCRAPPLLFTVILFSTLGVLIQHPTLKNLAKMALPLHLCNGIALVSSVVAFGVASWLRSCSEDPFHFVASYPLR